MRNEKRVEYQKNVIEELRAENASLVSENKVLEAKIESYKREVSSKQILLDALEAQLETAKNTLGEAIEAANETKRQYEDMMQAAREIMAQYDEHLSSMLRTITIK